MTPTHYEVLQLQGSVQDEAIINPQTLRRAYRRALLQNHPDKSQPSPKPTLNSSAKAFSIDQISEAFRILSDPVARAEYNKALRLQYSGTRSAASNQKQTFRAGVETVDLDDLEFDNDKGQWYRSCRCGDARGFLIREVDLEEAADDGELNVGCAGCSLWLKVVFATVEDTSTVDVIATSTT